MKKIIIKQANNIDKNSILEFIKHHWSPTHILTKKNNIFDNYYKEKKKLNFLIAKDKNKIVGLLGFIKDEKYSKLSESIVWTSILKSLQNYPTIGILLVNKLINKFKGSDIGCMGNNIQSEKLFKLLGFLTKNLNHYYIINPKYSNFNLIKFKKKNKISLIKKKPRVRLKYIRVIDHFGNFEEIINTIYLFHELLNKYDAEYIDFYSSRNIPSLLLKFINKNYFKKDIIIPNYYEPFIQKNIKIRSGIFFKKIKRSYELFKSEGDSERPNLI